MTINNIQKSSIADDTFLKDIAEPETPFYPEDPWFRNPSWLSLPEVSPTEQKFRGLLALDPSVNLVRLGVEMDTGLDSFRVDWGDGTVEDFTDPATNLSAVAQHSYDYSDAQFDGTDAPVTFTASTNTVNRTAHGYTNGMFITFADVGATTDIDKHRTYWVVNATENTFQIATEKNGSPLDITIDGSGKILPYKQVIVTVTPIQGRIISLGINARHTDAIVAIYDSGWLDVEISMPYATSIGIGTFSTTTRVVGMNRLERAAIRNAGVAPNLSYLFYLVTNLQSVPVLNFPDTVTSMISLFNGCRRLKTIPSFNTKNVQDVSSLFSGCFSLEEAPFLDLKNCYLTPSMFLNCYSLKSVPLYDLSNVYSMASMFQNCSNLKQVPKFDTSSVRFMGSMFSGCTSVEVLPHLETKRCSDFSFTFSLCYMLRTIQGLDTRNATFTSGMFSECSKLKTVPLMDMRNVVTATSMFSGCASLITLPPMTFESLVLANSMFTNCNSLEQIYDLNITSPNLTNTSSMFSGCTSLERVPQFNTSKVTSVGSMFATCARLREVPDMDLSSCITFTSMFSGCSALERAPKMITTALGGGTPYTKLMDSMFTSCFNLKYVPPFDTSKASTVANMFFSAFNLEYAPDFDLSMCTSMFRMFRDCPNLKKVGKLTNTNNVTSIGDVFYVCTALTEIPEIDCSGVTSAAGFALAFSLCYSSAKFNPTNINYTFSVANHKLSAAELNQLYTNLPTVTGQTVTVSANWGTSADDPTIATAKGWTVTG
jgi:surface protein